MRDEFEYIMSISEKLEAGKWIAVVGDKIVATSDKSKEVFDEAKRQYPDREPFIMKVPDNRVMLL